MTSSGVPAPGWYPDPHDPQAQRYWDGANWTEHSTAPVHDPRSDVLTVTTDQLPGRCVTRSFGIVYGVFSGTHGGTAGLGPALDMMGTAREKPKHSENAVAARKEAELRMCAEAMSLGANAVIGVRFTASPTGAAGTKFEIVAYGTAVESLASVDSLGT